MGIEHGLLIANVAHARQRPKKNAFRYRVYYLSVALSDISTLAKSVIFSLNRFNLFSFHVQDYGDHQGQLEVWLRGVLGEWGVTQANGDITLVTLPRVLGYAFNPVTFWFCFDAQGGLRAVISEVNNTFGDKHCYISFHDDQRIITPDDWLRAEKIFHVSPFIAINGYYLFRFYITRKKIGVWINHYDDNGLLLTTSVVGKRIALTTFNLLNCFWKYPMVTLKVIGLIHYQAIKLMLRGIRYQKRPQPPESTISR